MYRVGIGHDRHRFGEGKSIRLGGIDIPHDHGLIGHSDADVLLHAVTDALLGAAGLGDIGEMFPDTDPANRGRNSRDFLEAAVRAISDSGWSVVNIDSTIFAQRPKLAEHKPAIKKTLADILQIGETRIGVKAKTGEHVGPVGNEECIDVHCVALLKRSGGEE